MSEELFLFLSSRDSSQYYANTPSRFTVQLSREIQLVGSWFCALGDITFTTKLDNYTDSPTLNVCTNICRDSSVGSNDVQILRRIPTPNFDNLIHHTFIEPYYMPVIKKNFSTITIYITDETLDISNIKNDVSCTIRLKKG